MVRNTIVFVVLLIPSLVGFSPQSARAEVLVLKDGRRLEGLIIQKDDREIVLDMGTITSRWPRADVEAIEPGLAILVFRQRINRAIQTAEQQARAGQEATALRTLAAATSPFQAELDAMQPKPKEVQDLLDRLEAMRRSLIPKSPESQKAEELLQQAIRDLDFAREVDAFRRLREAVALDPARADIQHRLGRVASRINEPEAAIRAFGAAIRLEPDAYYASTAAPLVALLEDRGRRLLSERRPDDAVGVFQELLLFRAATTGPVPLDEFLARQLVRESQPPEEVLLEVYKYADDNDLVDLAFAAVRRAAAVKPDDPRIQTLVREETLINRFRSAIAEGNLELAAALQAESTALVPRVAERLKEMAGAANPDIQAAALLTTAKRALEGQEVDRNGQNSAIQL